MTTAQVVETSVTVNNNSPIQDLVHPDDQTQPTFIIIIVIRFMHEALARILKATLPYTMTQINLID